MPFLRCPDSTGWGVHVLTAARDPQGGIWVGTYGRGMFRLAPGAKEWQSFHHDSTAASISMDFVQAIAFGPRGEIWYGTVGNGWGLSLDGGVTWRNWTYEQLGPEWQYVAPGRHRGARGHDDDRHRRRSPDHHRRRGALERHRRQYRPPGEGTCGHRLPSPVQ